MKNVVALAALLAAAPLSLAIAADLPSLKESPAAPLPPPPLWTGFYGGVNAGYAWNENENVNFGDPLAYLNPATTSIGQSAALAGSASGSGVLSPGGGGFIGGGQVGYNMQFGDWLAGLETDIQGVASNSSTQTRVSAAPWSDFFLSGTTTATESVSRRLDYLGTVRGRLGYLVAPNLLA